ncbi:hypothetical protein [Streptomyces sp. NPDC058155]|uniref:hypothetical protein n=1 Tax=Streptomyces sp. NPDC058155 TaxID=3346359 RepID=UPI0036E28C9A
MIIRALFRTLQICRKLPTEPGRGDARIDRPLRWSRPIAAYSSTFDMGGMTSTFHQEHPDAALARTPVPPKLINITRPWIEVPPKPIDKRRHYCGSGPLRVAR